MKSMKEETNIVINILKEMQTEDQEFLRKMQEDDQKFLRNCILHK